MEPKILTVEEIQSWPVNDTGWHVGPDNRWIKIGNGVQLGNDVRLGNYAEIGNYAKIGDCAKIGDRAKIGDCAKIGNNMTSQDLNELFRKNYICSAPYHIFTKWVTPDRESPGWGSASKIAYPVGATIAEPTAQISDQQCAAGLHVFRYGYRPEWVGLGEGEELIEIHVKVASEDICFAGLPGNDAKLRVRKLEVLD